MMKKSLLIFSMCLTCMVGCGKRNNEPTREIITDRLEEKDDIDVWDLPAEQLPKDEERTDTQDSSLEVEENENLMVETEEVPNEVTLDESIENDTTDIDVDVSDEDNIMDVDVEELEYLGTEEVIIEGVEFESDLYMYCTNMAEVYAFSPFPISAYTFLEDEIQAYLIENGYADEEELVYIPGTVRNKSSKAIMELEMLKSGKTLVVTYSNLYNNFTFEIK